MKQKILMLAVIAALLLLGGTAMADETLIGTNLYASSTYTASGGTYTGSITFDNTSTTNQMLIGFGLDLGSGNFTVTSVNFTGLPSGWEYGIGNLGGNNGGYCDLTSGTNQNWICADGFETVNNVLTFTPGVLTTGTTTFYFSGTYTGGTPATILDLQGNGCTTTNYTGPDKQGTINCTDNKWAYSADIVTNGNIPTPEPASLALLGAGLLGLGGLVRRKKR